MAHICALAAIPLSPYLACTRARLSASAGRSLLGPPFATPHRLSPSRGRPFLVMASAEGSATATETVATPEVVPVEEAASLLSGLDLRVGRILKAWRHPEADSLYVEEVDMGEKEGPRTICSGLVKFVPEEDMQNKLVVVLANLKPRNMRGVKSNGMLLCASDAAHEHVELLVVPEGAAPGERVWFGEEGEGTAQEPAATPNQLQKKKIWEAVQPHLRTTEEFVAAFEGKPMRVSSGIIKSKSLTGGSIS